MLTRLVQLVSSSFLLLFFSCLAWLSFQSYLAAVDETNQSMGYSASGVERELHIGVSSAPFNPDWYRSASLLSASRGDNKTGLGLIWQGVAYRPTWPYDRLLMAHMLASNFVYDDRMTAAVASVRKYGPSERALQYDSSVFLLVHWYQMSEEQREILLPGLEAVLGREAQARPLFFEIERLRRERLFCRRLQSLVEYGGAWCSYFRGRAESRRSGG